MEIGVSLRLRRPAARVPRPARSPAALAHLHRCAISRPSPPHGRLNVSLSVAGDPALRPRSGRAAAPFERAVREGERVLQHAGRTLLRPITAALLFATVAPSPSRAQSPGITVSPTSGLVTSEAGGTASFTVHLAAPPTATVTIALASDRAGEGVASPGTLTFDATNWDVDQTVTVTGVDDAVDDGDQPYLVVLYPAVSDDAQYNGMDPDDVSVTNLDNDTAGITVTPTSGLVTTEAAGTASFTVVLNSQPTADVTIPVASTDLTEGTVSASSLTFTPANWNVAQTVTVTGVDDAVQDGDIAYGVMPGLPTTSDPIYAAIDPADVALVNADNDTAGVTVTPVAGLVTTEAGGTATFSVVLRSRPTATVTIPVASTDLTEGTASVASLRFTTTNWNVPRTVTVTGVDDL